MDFSNIIGHEVIINNLKKAIKNNSISHSYLFEGPKLIGKRTVAKAFAKTLLCQKEGTEPCNTCASCIQFNSGNMPDFYIESPEGQYFKKEQIDKIQKSMRRLPYEGKRKVYILENIDKMTQEAQNSFLKTLEEPPTYAVIIMTVVNSNSLLPTIISRCQLVRFSPIENNKIKDFIISKYEKTEEEASFTASFSNGIIGKAIKICESEEFKQLREDVISIIDNTINSEKFKIFSISEFFEKNKESIEDILDMIIIWFRDLLIMKETDNYSFIINRDKIQILEQHSSKLSIDKIYDIIERVKETKDDIASKVNFQLAVEVMLLEMQEV
ncbi:DNA polymerase III subunit delta' [Thermohalobacter berrensis]|uniref:DNA polymerase III subunit delta' n=1 Tax=Thermohalobacter berrensis TaxID=99594 RepID=A0A419SUB4_9FIRM|nr:DNA polymerase III subunit delta' [Thermohalobacter berrensis]RKD28829.1 DNA polymerase III subunit delta' [Thermohalobacter berrensis]